MLAEFCDQLPTLDHVGRKRTRSKSTVVLVLKLSKENKSACNCVAEMRRAVASVEGFVIGTDNPCPTTFQEW